MSKPAKTDDKKPTATPATTPPAEPAKPEASREELDSLLNTMLTALPDPGAKRKPREEPKVDAPVVEDPPKEKAEKPAKPAKEPKDKTAAETPEVVEEPAKPVAKKKPAVPESVRRMEEAADRLEKLAEPKAEPEPKKPDAPKLSARDQFRLEVYGEMDKQEPAGKLVERFTAANDKWGRYRAQWEKEHDGEDFNEDSDEHDAIYAKLYPAVDEDDYVAAAAELKAAKLYDKREREREEKMEREQSKRTVAETSKSLVEQETKALLKEVAGKDVDFEKLSEEEPAVAFAIEKEMDRMTGMVEAAVELLTPGSGKKFDLDGNKTHLALAERLEELDADISELPDEQKLWRTNGQTLRFATRSEYVAMSPAERAKHWTLWNQPTHVAALLRGDAVERAKSKVAKLQSKPTSQPEEKTEKPVSTKPAAANGNPPPAMAGSVQRPPSDKVVPATTDGRSALLWR